MYVPEIDGIPNFHHRFDCPLENGNEHGFDGSFYGGYLMG